MNDADRRTVQGALFTDLYQLTMAQTYFRHGVHERPAQFDHFFRSYPDYGGHQAGYVVSAGLAWFLTWLAETRWREQDVEHLRSLRGSAGARTFDDAFLAWLRDRPVGEGVRMRAVPEGRVVHAGAPLAVVEGPLAALQLIETSLLNHLNYPSLIATKAARLHQAAAGGAVLDFGIRRGHERGVHAGSRAALIGGVDATSNTGLAFALGETPRGTHAHAMVQAFMALGYGEEGAFDAYADAYPDDCLLLVDTVDTLGSGVPNAIRTFERLRARGHEPLGIRLDSGDLAHLAIQSAAMLDRAGFANVRIVLSNELDEFTIWQIRTQIVEEAPAYGVDPEALLRRLAYGVGTRLITSQGDAALDGVYKLVRIQGDDGAWLPAVKLSESPAKVLTPGDKHVWRLYDRRDKATADLVTLADEDPRDLDRLVLHHPAQVETRRTVTRAELTEIESLLAPAFADGAPTVDPREPIATLRERCRADLARLDPGVRRVLRPHRYHVSLSPALAELRDDTVRRAREGVADAEAAG
ncbi:MAG: nicotinate phosphoribosyltransferase [Trueperaceae bacterium]